MVTVLIAALVIAVVIGLGAALAIATWRVTGWADVATWPRDPVAPIAVAPVALTPVAWPAPAIVRRGQRPGIVLIHGALGFDAIGIGRARFAYFRRVAPRLEAAGYDVITVRLPKIGCVPSRAAALARTLADLPHDRLALFAHSMGGLDARWAIARTGLAARVESLITIGTPHRGSPLADLMALRPIRSARALLGRFGLTTAALDWLTTWRWAELNRELLDVASVRYASIVGATADRARVHPLLRASHAYLAHIAGPSDGLVTDASQRWGETIAEVELDHFAQVGWAGGHDAATTILDALTHVGAGTIATSAHVAPRLRASSPAP